MVNAGSAELLNLFARTSLAEVTGDDVSQLPVSRPAETTTLEFKLSYGNSEQDKVSFGSDVSAMANSSGGLLIVGISETQGIATGAPGVSVAEAEELRLRQILSAKVQPSIVFELRRVPHADLGVDRGYMLITVAASIAAPHAVVTNPQPTTLRYFIRSGPQNRSLSEPEVAGAYRQRLEGIASRRERMDVVWEDASALVDRTNAWLAVALVPDVPATMLLNADLVSQLQTGWPQAEPQLSINRTRVRPGMIIGDGGQPGPGLAQWGLLVLHTDGSVVAARTIGFPNDAAQSGFVGSVRVARHEISDHLLWSLDAFARLTQRFTGAAGSMTLRAGLWAASSSISHHVLYLAHPDYVRQGWEPPNPSLREEPIVGPFTPTDIVGRVDRLSTLRTRIIDAVSLANGIAQSLGVPELEDLRPDGSCKPGSLVARRWQPGGPEAG